MPEPTTETTVTITVNGKEIEARPGELVIAAAERHGVYIPRFCYHPRMQPVGMCRMCLVEVDTGRGPAIQPSCMLPVAPDMKVETDSPTAKKAQEGVLEFLLVNHPLDCPVCDKGGECPLQDHTVAFGPGESRFVEEKRHYEKPIEISATVMLDRERCILCDRCTRFADEVAGDPLIHFQGRGANTEVNTFPGHPFASYFSGNTVQICPVGALTAKPYRFKARPWDLEAVESTCTSCAVGCRVVIDSARNEVLRYNGVDSDPVNWSWLCDKGRFDFESVNHEDRLRGPLVRAGQGGLAEARWSDALTAAADAIRAALDRSGPAGIAVLGGARLTNEDQYAWAKLAKGVIGTDNVDAQLGDGLSAECVLGLPRTTIDEAFAPGGTVVLIGPDLKEELPVLFLRLRHAVVNDRVRVVEIAAHDTGVSPLATHSLRCSPGAEAELVQALVDGTQAPAGVDADRAAAVHDLLRGDAPVTVLLGRPSLAASSAGVEAAAAHLVDAIDGARVLPLLRRGNVRGALDMGLAPGVLPGRVGLDEGRAWFAAAWPTVPETRGLDATGILAAAAGGKLDVLVLLGADPLADFPDRDLATRALAGARTVIASDLFLTESVALADIVLPAAGYAEVEGTTTNTEGRVTTLRQKVTPPGTAATDRIIASELARRLGADLGVASPDVTWDEIERLAPSHAGITRDLLWSSEHADGVMVPIVDDQGPTPDHPVDAARLDQGDPDEVDDAAAAVPPADGTPGAPSAESAAQADAFAAEARVDASSGEPEAHADHGEAAAHAADAAAVSADAAWPRVSAAEDDADPAGNEAEGYSEPSGGAEDAPGDQPAGGLSGTGDAVAAETRPQRLRFRAGTGPGAAGGDTPSTAPAVDAYSLRLVTVRRMYDLGTLVQHSPAIAKLGIGAGVWIHPGDLERLGVDDGGRVRLTSSRGSITTAVRADAGVPRGIIAMAWNRGEPLPSTLIDASQPVTDVRVETVS